MIKETLVTLAFCATLVEKHPQPDLPHKNYWHLSELQNGVRAYGNIMIGQTANSKTESSFAAMLVT